MPHQQDLFSDAPEARECVECGEKFVPEKNYHQYCPDCFERKQNWRKRLSESNAEWVERFYSSR